MQKKALITGCSGFIGSNLAKLLLDQGWVVASVNRADSVLPQNLISARTFSVYLYDGSMDSIDAAVRDFRPDIVFHLASRFIAEHKTSDITDLILSNILFGNYLLEAMAKNNIKNLINASTSWQYYHSDKYRPVNLYAGTKQAFLDICCFYRDAFDMKIVDLVIFDTYGPNDIRGKIVGKLIEASQKGNSFDLSPGEQEIDLVYIEDVCRAFLFSVNLLESERWKAGPFMITSQEPVKLKELVTQIEKITDRKIHINWGARPYRKREVMKSFTSTNLVDGWRAQTSLIDGLKIILQSYQ